MALITCQARVTSVSPGCSCTGSHHQATGMRVIMTPPIAFLLRTFLHADVHQFEVFSVWLEPEVDGVLLLGFILVVKDGVCEPSIAFHAAHDLDLLVDEIQVGVELRGTRRRRPASARRSPS